MDATELLRFKEDGFEKIHGWCSEHLFSTLSLIDSASINKSGGCMEIGIHHGKFFILLNRFIDPNYKSYAVDVFDDQHLNIDMSGMGSLDNFKNNLSNYDVHKGRNVVIIQGDSTDPALNLREKVGLGSMRFISIDGGHTVEHTIADLNLACDLISNQGVVILDDILNYHWLGVIEGTFRFLDTHPTLVPFAIGHNKLYMCKLSYAQTYYELFQSSELMSKNLKFAGHDVVAL